jgi:hypothetical protein
MWTVARVELVKGPALKIISPEVISGDEDAAMTQILSGICAGPRLCGRGFTPAVQASEARLGRNRWLESSSLRS